MKEMMKLRGDGALPQTQQLFFGEGQVVPPLSTLLSLLEQASVRNDEGRRAPARSAIILLEKDR